MDPTLLGMCVILIIGVGVMLAVPKFSNGILYVSIMAILVGGAEWVFGMMLSGFDNPRQGAQMQHDGQTIVWISALVGAFLYAISREMEKK
ncbi:hypothetical protein LBMAG21_16720 [Armatimonadota bacterium]|nr:hypothetical protein LBMAG21_16720 [Armatimonadota bacterium]